MTLVRDGDIISRTCRAQDCKRGFYCKAKSRKFYCLSTCAQRVKKQKARKRELNA